MSETLAGDQPNATFDPPRTIVSSIYELNPLMLEELAQWLEMRGLRTTISQVTGLRGFNQVALASTNTDVVIGNGATVVVLTTTATLAGQDEAEFLARFPAFEFTDTAGGEAEVIINVDGTDYAMGRLKTDRQFQWPVAVVRRTPVTRSALFTLQLKVQSLNGNVTAHAGTGYGTIYLEISAKYPGT